MPRTEFVHCNIQRKEIQFKKIIHNIHVRIRSPESISGHVQIFIFQLKNKNLDASRIEIWTRPDFLFSIEK